MKTCLVVDDSKVVRTVARRIVEEIGFEVTEAENGEKAVAACEASMPDAIMLDWNMPVMNGLEFITTLRQMPGGDVPKVIFCTTENDMAHIVEAMSMGANEYIMKPFDGDIVQSKFAQVGLID
jgi:two-component system, chemotaxis family, chemotaxis protein CheY